MTFWLAEEHVKMLPRCANDIEDILRKELKAVDVKIKKAPRKSSRREELQSEWVYVYETLRQNIRYALFVSSYAQFEQALFSISEDLTLRFEVPVTVRDIAGQGVRRYQTFFKKVLRVPFPDDEPEWERVLRLGELRNYLVHKTTWVSKRNTDKKILDIIGREKYLWAPESGPLEFDRRFVPNVGFLFEAFIVEFGYRCVEDKASLGNAHRRLSLKRVKTKILSGLRR